MPTSNRIIISSHREKKQDDKPLKEKAYDPTTTYYNVFKQKDKRVKTQRGSPAILPFVTMEGKNTQGKKYIAQSGNVSGIMDP